MFVATAVYMASDCKLALLGSFFFFFVKMYTLQQVWLHQTILARRMKCTNRSEMKEWPWPSAC